MDSELFELCKKVYERTGWERDDYNYGGKAEKYIHRYGQSITYTSDYLLEKLPATIENTDYNSGGIDRSKRIALQLRKWDRFVNGGIVYFAEYHEMYYIPLFSVEADTPLKALLKLTISLSEAGELK